MPAAGSEREPFQCAHTPVKNHTSQVKGPSAEDAPLEDADFKAPIEDADEDAVDEEFVMDHLKDSWFSPQKPSRTGSPAGFENRVFSNERQNINDVISRALEVPVKSRVFVEAKAAVDKFLKLLPG
jgi:hypothetical protein